MLDYIQVHCARKVEWIYTFLCLEYKRKDILGIFEKFLGQNLKKSSFAAIWVSLLSHTCHMRITFLRRMNWRKEKVLLRRPFCGKWVGRMTKGQFFITMAAKTLGWKCFCGGMNTEIKIRRAVYGLETFNQELFWGIKKMCQRYSMSNASQHILQHIF